MDKCKCSMATRLFGDDCEICNPAPSLEYARHTIEYLREEIGALEQQLAECQQDRQREHDLRVRLAGELEEATKHVQGESVNRRLLEAAKLAAEQIKNCDYTPARSTLLCAIKEAEGGAA